MDHQGSLVALSDENGRVTSRMSFDPWGNRRALDENGWHQWLQLTQSLPMAWDQKFRSMLSWTERGYTGHEHVDGLGFIHMGGRIYDPMLGRFLQADPFMEDTGTLNRYTYVHNNPLGWVDPSGFRARRGNYNAHDLPVQTGRRVCLYLCCYVWRICILHSNGYDRKSGLCSRSRGYGWYLRAIW